MKAVAPYSEIPELARHRKTCRDFGQRTVKSGVEAHDLRELGEARANRLDRRNFTGQMQRHERNDLPQRREHFGRDQFRRGVIGAAMDDSMTDRDWPRQVKLLQLRKNCTDNLVEAGKLKRPLS
jgi:hypothetical protein